MKQFLIMISLVLFIAAAMASRGHIISSIYGSIEPAGAATKVWAIKGTDTLTVIPEAGKFSIAVTGGRWRLLIGATKPYKDVVVDNVLVEEGKSTSVGTITLKAD